MSGSAVAVEIADGIELRQRGPFWSVVIFAVSVPVAVAVALHHLPAPEWMIPIFPSVLLLIGATIASLCRYQNSQEPILIFHAPSATISMPRQRLTIPAVDLQRIALAPASWWEAGEFFSGAQLVFDGGALILYTSLGNKNIDRAWKVFCVYVAKAVADSG